MTGRNQYGDEDSSPFRTRRDVLAAAGAAGVAALAGCGGDGGETTTTESQSPYANYPVSGDTVTIGAGIPEKGIYNGEGEDLLAGYKLAVHDLNNSSGLVNTIGGISGGGINGKEVELVTADTESDSSEARDAALSVLGQGATMVTGCASPSSSQEFVSIAEEEQAIHMVGFAPGNRITGRDCSKYSFQGMFNPKMMAKALAPDLIDAYGRDNGVAMITPNSDLGDSIQSELENELGRLSDGNWHVQRTYQTRPGTQTFDTPIQNAVDLGPDVIILNYYGLDGANALRAAKKLADEDMEIVVPLYDRAMATVAADAIEGVIGTVQWDTSLPETQYSSAFIDAWNSADIREVNAREPTGVAHLAYFQTMQYAAAVEGAGSFKPPDVIQALEGRDYATGMGRQTMRACDHQAIRPVPVVKGLPGDQQEEGKRYTSLHAPERVEYSCSEKPAADCQM